MSAADSILTVTLIAAIGAGGYAYWLQGKLITAEATVAHQGEQITSCTHEKDTAKTDAERREAEVASTLKGSQSELAELRAQHVEQEKRLEAFRALTEKFHKMIDSGRLQVAVRHGRMIVKLPASILFATGRAEVSKEGKAALVEVAGILKQLPDRLFMVAGHTDNVPIGPPSPFKNNLQLSTARAETVAEDLIAAGMDPAHLSAAGYSEYEPVKDNKNEAARQENRRIEIVLLPNLEEMPSVLGDVAAPATSASAAASSGPPTVR